MEEQLNERWEFYYDNRLKHPSEEQEESIRQIDFHKIIKSDGVMYLLTLTTKILEKAKAFSKDGSFNFSYIYAARAEKVVEKIKRTAPSLVSKETYKRLYLKLLETCHDFKNKAKENIMESLKDDLLPEKARITEQEKSIRMIEQKIGLDAASENTKVYGVDTGEGYGAPTKMPLLKTPRSYISDRAISVLDNSITSASILDQTILTEDLTDSSITTVKLADSLITSNKIAKNAVVKEAVAISSISTEAIIDSTLTNIDISPDAAIEVSKINIPDGSIALEKINLEDGIINYSKLNVADGEIPFSKILIEDEEIPFEKLNITQENINGLGIVSNYTGGSNLSITETTIDLDDEITLTKVTADLTGDVTGNAATATALETARNIGGISFDGTTDINLPGVNQDGNQNTSGNAATATTLSSTLPISLGGTGATTAAAARNSLGIYSGVHKWKLVNGVASVKNDIELTLPDGVTLIDGTSIITATLNSNDPASPIIIYSVTVKNSTTVEVTLNSALNVDDKISYIIIP